MGHSFITDPEGEHAFHASNVRGAERNSRKPQNVRGVQKCQRSTDQTPPQPISETVASPTPPERTCHYIPGARTPI